VPVSLRKCPSQTFPTPVEEWFELRIVELQLISVRLNQVLVSIHAIVEPIGLNLSD
jgi:hypothetical protein